MIKRCVSLLIVAIILLLGMTSCGYFSKPSDEEMKKAVAGLLPDAYTATYIVYGPGLKLDEEEKKEFDRVNDVTPYKNAHYIKVDEEEPYNTEKEIRELVRKVFSKDYADEVLAYAFENSEYMSRYHEYGGVLAMEVVQNAPMDMLDEIFVDTLTVIEGNAYACTVEVEATQNGEKRNVKIQMVFENEKWMFNGPAY